MLTISSLLYIDSSFENNLKDSYEKYFNKYYHLGVKSIKNKNSVFFNGIYKESKNQFNNDEEKCLEEAENKINFMNLEIF